MHTVRSLLALLILGLTPGPTVGTEAAEEPTPQIVNGVPTQGFPTTVALLWNRAAAPYQQGAQQCTGTLIGCSTVLTAAHCLCSGDAPCIEPNEVFLQHAGRFPVASAGLHPLWDGNVGNSNDVAVLYLATPVTGIKPTPINAVVDPTPGTSALIAGFGRTGGDLASVLDSGIKRAGAVQLVTGCPDGASQICWNFVDPLGNPGEDSSTCQGDSGGPLFWNDTVAGITSFGTAESCLPTSGAVDANVYYYRELIAAAAGSDLGGPSCGDVKDVDDPSAVIPTLYGTIPPGSEGQMLAAYFEVPDGMAELRVALNATQQPGAFPSGPFPDFDLLLRRGAAPTLLEYDCPSARDSQFEDCQIDDPMPGTWYLGIYVYNGAGEFQATITMLPPAPVVPSLDPIDGEIVAGATNELTGSGFTAGSLVKVFVATSGGTLSQGPFAPTAWTPTSLAWDAPSSMPLGNGFVTLQIVNTDQEYTESEVRGAPLFGNPALGIPSILSVDAVALGPSEPSIPTANVETVVAQGNTVTIGGLAFSNPLVNLFTAAGNVGPLTPLPGASAESFQIQIPPQTVTGPGSLQVVNAPYVGDVVSNAVSVPIGEALDITSITSDGATVTVSGAGFCDLTVINFFASAAGGLQNFGGLDGNSARIPLTVFSENEFSFTVPTGALPGAAYVTALNPPFIPFSSTADDPDGAFTLP
jgi:trypsin